MASYFPKAVQDAAKSGAKAVGGKLLGVLKNVRFPTPAETGFDPEKADRMGKASVNAFGGSLLKGLKSLVPRQEAIYNKPAVGPARPRP